MRNVRGRMSWLLVALAVLLVSCGSDDTESGADPSGPSDVASPSDSSEPDATMDGTDSDWDAVVAAAEEEGEVTLYTTSVPAVVERFKDAWASAYPDIELVVVNERTADLRPRVEAEMGSGSVLADVVSGDGDAWFHGLHEEGRWAVPVGPSFDNPDYDAARWQPDGTWSTVYGTPAIMVWNTDLWPQGLTKYADLLNDDLAGSKIGLVDPAVASIITGLYEFIEEHAPEGFLEDLAELDPRVYSTTPEIIAAVTAGEIYVSAYAASAGVQDAIDEGAPLAFAPPPEAWTIVTHSGIPVGAPHPNAAQVLLNFRLSMEGQTALAYNAHGVLPGIPGALSEPQDAIPAGNVSDDVHAAFLERFSGLFQ